jgi:signal transduction histidine kinase
MSGSGERAPATGLSLRLALASLASALAVAVVCGVGLISLRNAASFAQVAVSRQIATLDDYRGFQALLFQKGFLAQYMLTRDRVWLDKLEQSRQSFQTWLDAASAEASTDDRRGRLLEIGDEYARYLDAGRRAVGLFDSGEQEQAVRVLSQAQTHTERLLALIHTFGDLRRRQAQLTVATAEDSTRRLAELLVAVSVLGALASVAAGFLWARRFARPIYELRVRAQSAAHLTRIQVDPNRDDLEGLAEHVTGLITRIEEIDDVLVEQRRRLAQNEKLSELGELAAKLAHELLNPIAGMKAAIQLLARRVDATQVRPEEVRQTAEALDGEINRIEQLVRRLVDYARPLSPQFEVCVPAAIVDAALAASRTELTRAQALVSRRVEANLPPLEADPLLLTQALSNLICNAAQAMSRGGTVELDVRRLAEHGRELVVFQVADRGAGLPADAARLFRPFYTTKPTGHGLGLAVSQHIAVEHGGRISARNRSEGAGAVFEVSIPVVR